MVDSKSTAGILVHATESYFASKEKLNQSAIIFRKVLKMPDDYAKNPLFKIAADSAEKAVPELILELLSEEWPLSPKGLLERLEAKYSHKITLQGMHKAIKKMEAQKILAKHDCYYKLNTDWLEKISEFSRETLKNYGENTIRLRGMP